MDISVSALDLKRQEQLWLEQDQRKRYELSLAQGCLVANTYLSQTYLDNFSESTVLAVGRNVCDVSRIRMMHISKIVYDPSEDFKDKLISVYGSLYNSQSSVALLICGKEKRIEFYICTRNEINPSLAGELLEKNLLANFPGTDYSMMSGSEIESII